MAGSVDAALLLEQSDWIRQLAGRLVDDPHSADDLVQDTWVAALRSPEQPRSPRGFLATILKNLVRDRRATDGHRDARERDAARPEAQPSADDLVAELQMQRKVAAIVTELPENLRTPLLLRYWRSASLEEIASHQGVAISTVHDRLQRGIEELRLRLDKAHGGDRRAWAGVLIPFCQPTGAVSTTLGEVLAVSSTQKIAALVVAAVTSLSGLWWMVRDTQPLKHEALAQAPTDEETTATPTADEAPTAAVEEARTAAPSAPVEAAAPTTSVATMFMGRVIDLEGLPVGGLEVGYESDSAESTIADSNGRFELVHEETSNDRVVAHGETYATVVPGRAPRTAGEEVDSLIIVAERQTIAGWISDEEGNPLANIELTAHVSDSLFRKLSVLRHWSIEPDAIAVMTDANGAFEFEDLAGGADLRLSTSPAGFAPYNEVAPEHEVLDLHIVLERTQGPDTIFGRVVDVGGQPVPDALVSWLGRVEPTDAEGRFRIAKPESNPDMLEALGRTTDFTVLRAVKAGHLPAEVSTEALPASPIELVLGGPPLSISGRVVDDEGRPRRAVVWVLDESPLGHIVEQGGEGNTTISFAVMTESLLRGGDNRRGQRGIFTDEDGYFELGGLEDRFYRLHTFDPETWAAISPQDVQAGTHRIELVLPSQDERRVEGRITSVAGDPIVGLRVLPRRAFDGEGAPFGQWPTAAAVTDEDGHFEFAKLMVQETRLTYHSDEINFFEGHALADLALTNDLEDLEIELPRVARIQIDATERPDQFADNFTVEDADGEELEVSIFHGNMMYMSTHAPVQQGKSAVVQTDERAKTVVLYRDGAEVARTKIELAPEGLTTVRP